MTTPTTILDLRVPQPGREHEYGVPTAIVNASLTLYQMRNNCTDDEVPEIDAAILRLFAPWIRPEKP